MTDTHDHDTPVICPRCAGRGSLLFDEGGIDIQRFCPLCEGRGAVSREGGDAYLRRRREAREAAAMVGMGDDDLGDAPAGRASGFLAGAVTGAALAVVLTVVAAMLIGG